MNEHFLRLPFSRPGGCSELANLGSWSVVNEVLSHAASDVIVGREGTRWDGETPRCLADARKLLASGFTVGVRHAHTLTKQLAELAKEFEHDFAAPVDVHLYCTPNDSPGFGWHYDAEEVFVLQTHGNKTWELRKNTVNPWPLIETLPTDMHYGREIMPLMRCTLWGGDWLYVPAGYWHRTRAGEESISLSVGILPATGMDVFDFLRAELLSSLRWRQRLPTLGAASQLDQSSLKEAYRQLFAELGDDVGEVLKRHDVVQRFISKSGEAETRDN